MNLTQKKTSEDDSSCFISKIDYFVARKITNICIPYNGCGNNLISQMLDDKDKEFLRDYERESILKKKEIMNELLS